MASKPGPDKPLNDEPQAACSDRMFDALRALLLAGRGPDRVVAIAGT